MFRFLKRWLDSGARRRLTSRTIRRPSFRPGVESLDQRLLPSVSVVQVDTNGDAVFDKLLITGQDSTADKVIIRQNDSTGYLSIDHDADAAFDTFAASANIKTVEVKLYGGNDYFVYELADGTDFTNAKTIDLDLGSGLTDIATFALEGSSMVRSIRAALNITVWGDAPFTGGADQVGLYLGHVSNTTVTCTASLGLGADTFTAALFGNITNSDVSITANGGRGSDALKFDAVTFRTPTISALSTVAVNLNGQDDADTLDVRYTGLLRGRLTVNADGGTGKDSIYGSFYATSPFPWSTSDGTLDANFYGGLGSDTMNLNLTEQAPNNLNFAGGELPFIDGGEDPDGTDLDQYSCTTYGKVTVKNMELDLCIP